MSTQSEAGISGIELASVPGVQLQTAQPLSATAQPLSATAQPITDSDGNSSGVRLIKDPGATVNATALSVDKAKNVRFELGNDAAGKSASVSLGAPGTFNIDAVGIAGGRLAVTNDGKVGIGNAAPAYTLDVNGTINATAIRVGGGTATIPGIQPVINAPPGANVEAVFVNVATGILYYQ